jgi:hypothetical protein
MSDDTYMPLFTLLVYLPLWRKIRGNELVLLIYLIINVVFGTVTNIMGFYQINNLALYHLFTLFEQWFISYYLIRKAFINRIPKAYFLINIGFTIFWFINILGWEPLNVFNSNTAVISSLILLLLCMYYMLDLSKKEEILYFQKLPSFWIVSAFLIYSALSVLIFAVYKYYVLQDLTEEGNKIWSLTHFTTVAKYVLISVGLLCYNKRISIHSPSLL